MAPDSTNCCDWFADLSHHVDTTNAAITISVKQTIKPALCLTMLLSKYLVHGVQTCHSLISMYL
jgi:hypothetical protein